MPIVLTGLLGNFDLRGLLITVLVLTLSLSLHEFSHGWMALKMGDSTAADAGRLTLNPLKHLDPVGSIVFLVTQRIGWAKPVPVNPARFDRKRSMRASLAYVSIAGPLSNVILAFFSYLLLLIVITIYLLINSGDASSFTTMSIAGTIQEFLVLMFYANLTLAVFNLLPVPPLDGFKVLGAALPQKIYYKILEYERYIGLVFILLIIFGRGLISTVMGWIISPIVWLIQTPLDALFNWIWGLIF